MSFTETFMKRYVTHIWYARHKILTKCSPHVKVHVFVDFKLHLLKLSCHIQAEKLQLNKD